MPNKFLHTSALVLGMALPSLALAATDPAGSKAQATPATGQAITPASEAPKDLAILPWKNVIKGQLPQGKLQLVEVPLEPIDPQVFKRELEYFNQEPQQP